MPPLALYTAVMGWEMCYIYLTLDLWRSAGLERLSFAVILSLYPMAFLLKWLVTRSTVTASRIRTLAAVSGICATSLVAVVAVLHVVSTGRFAEEDIFPVILQIAIAGFSWWLGDSLVRDEISHRYLSNRFQCGLLVMLALTATRGTSFVPVILFFTLALLVLAVARWESSVARSPSVLQAFPVGVLVWSTLGVFVPATIMFLVLSPEAAQAIVGWMGSLVGIIGRLFPAIPPQPTSSQPHDFGFSCAPRPSDEAPFAPPPPTGTVTPESPAVLWALVLITYLATLIVVALAIRRIATNRRKEPAAIGVVESTISQMSLFETLVRFFRRLVIRILSRLLSLLRPGLVKRHGASADELTTSARGVYMNLMRVAAKKGAHREPSQTPLEFLVHLKSLFPQGEEDLALITRIYVADRYSCHPVGHEGFRLARQAWQRIRGR